MRVYPPFALLMIASACWAQGVVSGSAVAAPRPAASGRPFAVALTDVASATGLTMPFVQGDPYRKKYILEATGTGVAFVDFDNDGQLDVFLVNGTRFGANVPKSPSRLFRNQGGKFTDISAAAGLARTGWGNGVCAGDYDSDGFTDLYVTYWGRNALYRNLTGKSFVDTADSAGVAGPSTEWSTGCTFLDYDRDGKLDLLTVSYAGFDPKTTPLPGSSAMCVYRDQPVYCGPRGLPSGRVTLYRNGGEGRFTDVTRAAGLSALTGFYGFTTVAADLNQDGWTDVYVAADSTPSLHLRNNGDGTFRDLGAETGLAFNEHGAEQAGMGVAIADFNGDGKLDITKTNFIRDYPNLYRNLGKGIFEDSVFAAGMAVNPQFVQWGTAFTDLDNDGLPDVVQVSGHVYPELDKGPAAEAYKGPLVVYRNLGGGRFEEMERLRSGLHSSRGAAFGDFDNDGSVDVLVMNMDEPPSLWKNQNRSGNSWVRLLLRGTKSNRSAIGATVTLGAQTQPVVSQTSYLSVNDFRLHFGLGKEPLPGSFTVRWPSGDVETFTGAVAGKTNLVVEGERKATPLP